MKVTDYIAETLKMSGVDAVFGYQGSSIAHMIDSICSVSDLRFIECRNEQGAAFAANGYSDSGQRLGVAVACSGPGALNLMSGIADAFYDSLPCLFICGQVSQKEMKADPKLRQLGFQETEIISIVQPITKYAVTIDDPERIAEELERALALALEGRPGPVLLNIPHNIQSAQTLSIPCSFTDIQRVSHGNTHFEEDLREQLFQSTRPVIVIGGGCASVPSETMRLIDDLGIPVITSYRGKGFYDNTLDSHCGTWGVYGSRAANWAAKYSDLLLCLGTRLDGRQTAGEPLQLEDAQNVMVVDIDESELKKTAKEHAAYVMDVVPAIESLIKVSDEVPPKTTWLGTVRSWAQRYPSSREYRLEDLVNPNLFLETLSASVKIPANYCLDVGQNQLWANASLAIGPGQRLIQSGGLGAMGFALPAAIGAYAENGHLTICIAGDGGIQMNIQELQTVAEYGLPIKTLVFNNESLGLIRDYQSKALAGRTPGSVEGFGSPNYALLAQAYGLSYLHIQDVSQMATVLEALQDDAPWLIEVSVSPLSTAKPEPSYGNPILYQADLLTSTEMELIESEARGVR